MKSLSKDGLAKGKPLAAALWQWDGPPVLTGCEARELLGGELTAFFASRQCPGSAIRAAMDWAVQQARAKRAVVSGFHSPLEQSVLKVLMAAGSSAVVVLARPVEKVKLLPEWNAPLDKGRLAVVSGGVTAVRLTEQLAMERNGLVAKLIMVAHASLGGSLALQVDRWQREGRKVDVLPKPK